MFKRSKTLQRLADRDPRIKEYDCDQDGHWLILAEGYREADYHGTMLRQDTVTGMINRLHLIEPV